MEMGSLFGIQQFLRLPSLSCALAMLPSSTKVWAQPIWYKNRQIHVFKPTIVAEFFWGRQEYAVVRVSLHSGYKEWEIAASIEKASDVYPG